MWNKLSLEIQSASFKSFKLQFKKHL